MTVEIPKSYQPQGTEERLYAWWEEQGFFRPDVESSLEAFSMVLPPPNVTGSLHMGHALNHTLQDILARWKRMEGYSVLWLPGTDHAGIATQNVVERNLAREGRKRTDFSREKFEALVWEWKDLSENNILQQIRRLGCSCDWTRKRFTMDEGLSRAVREVFVQLYESGLIYRGEYLVNWCPRCGTAISDLEVEYEPKQGSLWHVRYPVVGSSEYVVVATTRPETMLGDTAVAIHPADERYRWLAGRKILLPLMGREIPVVFDTFVDREFGTGVVKVTPGHDAADFEAGRRHHLEVLKVIGEDGSMTASAGRYSGLDRYEARRRVVADLEELGLLESIRSHEHNVGHCQRCRTVVEPLVSTQWFVRVKPLAEEAIRAVEDGRTRFVPKNFEKVYFEWMYNLHDWCISRQLWWGHRIPAWYCDGCRRIVVSREQPESCAECGSCQLRQESDVLDTWFSSALWPFSTLGWPDETPELRMYYPTSAMVTGFDIIFFWVARMMMMGLRFREEVPFYQVFINGLVRDEHGQKMSKSRGNIIDPLEIIDQYGTDAVRFTLAVMAVPGTDIPFSISRMSGYRAFCNKIWNASRFLLLNLSGEEPVEEEKLGVLLADPDLPLHHRWIVARLQETIEATRRDFERFQIHEASNRLYHFFWGDFCDWYIELVKPDFAASDSRKLQAEQIAWYVLESSLRLLHPLIPFITEEIWQKMPHRGETIMLAPYPQGHPDWIDSEALAAARQFQELVTAMRKARAENDIAPRLKVDVYLRCSADTRTFLKDHLQQIGHLVRTRSISFVESFPVGEHLIQGAASLADFALDLDEAVDLDVELRRLEKEEQRHLAECGGLERKLSNHSFLEKAPPDVVSSAKQRHAEVTGLLKKVQEKLANLRKRS